ncbi:MAG: glycosyltransferase [Legionellales bacterium]|nr:glycosyltransferase [Legionellales bacterium]
MWISVRQKFIFASVVAILWSSFCIWLSIPWIQDLATVVTIVPAVLAIMFIALVPSFMYMFLFVSYIIDKRPLPPSLVRYPAVTILIAAFNEEGHILDTLHSIAVQQYHGPIQVIVIDDGSTDDTFAKVIEFKQQSQSDLSIIRHTTNKGKSHALNKGLYQSKYDLIVTLDADTSLSKYAVMRIVERLHAGALRRAAVAGSVHTKNFGYSLITKIQDWDYFNGLAPVKRVQSLYKGTLVVQGAFSIYRKECLLEVGGWTESLAEDIVLSWGWLARGYYLDFAENAIAFTYIPKTYRAFFWQRSRWARGMLEGFYAHPKVLAKGRLSTLFIYWNLLLPLIDCAFAFVFIPGLILAFFGYFYIVGPLTLAVLPLSLINNSVFFFRQRKIFRNSGLKKQRNILGFIFYLLTYTMLMSPSVIHGYVTHLLRLKKRWGTK